jgi:hypothetical protein
MPPATREDALAEVELGPARPPADDSRSTSSLLDAGTGSALAGGGGKRRGVVKRWLATAPHPAWRPAAIGEKRRGDWGGVEEVREGR